MNKNYSDEEIDDLIRDVEENYMLKAPLNLKTDILSKINADEEKHKKHRDNVTLTFYSIKVGVTVAAAIAILFITPSGTSSNIEKSNKFGDGLEKFTTNIEKYIEKITPSAELFRINKTDKEKDNNSFNE